MGLGETADSANNPFPELLSRNIPIGSAPDWIELDKHSQLELLYWVNMICTGSLAVKDMNFLRAEGIKPWNLLGEKPFHIILQKIGALFIKQI